MIPTPSSSLLMRVYQIHDASPADDRAVYLDYQVQKNPTEWILSFQITPTLEIKPNEKDYIPVKVNQGKWIVRPKPKGVEVELESQYDPGGSVPSFMVNWFVSKGVQTMMDELKTCIQK
jgi:hypothetical protein